MEYGSREYQYAAPLALALVEHAPFREWVISRSVFRGSANARILHQEWPGIAEILPLNGGAFTSPKSAAALAVAQVASASEEGSQVDGGVGGERGCETNSLHLFQQLPRFSQQRLNLPLLGDRIPGEPAVLARVLVCPWRA